MKHRQRTQGLVLIAVLWVNVLLILLVTMVNMTARLDMHATVQTGQEIQCQWAARAGTEMAIANLKADSQVSDSLDELWSDDEEDYNNLTLGACLVNIRVVDESGKLNLNVATRDQLMALPHMTADVAAAILDWRDRDDNVRQGGAEGGTYQNLTFGYPIRNGPFRTIRELLLVKGVQQRWFYGEDINRNGRLDRNEQDGADSPPDDNRDMTLDPGWIDLLTCCSYVPNTDAEGGQRVNIAKADQNTLQQDLGITASQAKWIVEQRDRNKFKSLGDLINEDSPRRPRDNAHTDGKESEPMDLQTYESIVDKMTLVDQKQIPGLINVNTARREVLEIVFRQADNPRSLADAVIAYREQLAQGLSSVGELLNVSGINVRTFKQVVDQVTVRSNVFWVQSMARARRTGLSATRTVMESIVDRGASPAEFLYCYQGARYNE